MESVKLPESFQKALEDYKKQILEENGDWKKRFYQVENFLSRLTVDPHMRKAWMVAGDHQMLTFYLNEIRKKESGLQDAKDSRS